MQKRPRFSIVIETANDQKDNDISFADSLRAIITQSDVLDNPEIILVNTRKNHSIHAKDAPHAKHVTKMNAGYFECKNYGFKYATGDIVIFLDADCIIAPGFFTELKKSFESGKIDALSGLTHFQLNSAHQKAMSVVQFYPVPRFQRTKVVNASILAIRREIFAKYPFAKTVPGTRVSIVEFSRKLTENGYMLYMNPKMRQIHKTYKKWIRKCLQTGHEFVIVFQHESKKSEILKQRRSNHTFAYFISILSADFKRAFLTRHLLRIKPLELAPVFMMILIYRFLNLIGMGISLIHPSFFKKNYVP